MPLPAIAEGVSIILSLVQAASQAATAAAEVTATIQRAQAEGRDLTDAELTAGRNAVVAARTRLVDAP